MDRFASYGLTGQSVGYWSFDTSWLRRQRSGWLWWAIASSRKRITGNDAHQRPLHDWLRRWCPVRLDITWPSLGGSTPAVPLRIPTTLGTPATGPLPHTAVLPAVHWLHAQTSRAWTMSSDICYLRTNVRLTLRTLIGPLVNPYVVPQTPKETS